MEAIILAGGLGTRLRSLVAEAPKSMALIQGRPFLEYQLDRFIAQGITRFIFSVGYKSDHIQTHFGHRYRGCEIAYAVEETQLGTGGAIKNAMPYVRGEHVLVANGDSIFLVDVQAQYRLHISRNADATLALKPMKNFERYGTLDLDADGRIRHFYEKRPTAEGLINGGIYLFHTENFRARQMPEKFSIEKDFFEAKVNDLNLYGYVSDGYFLDIGIPEDYRRSQYEIGLFPQIDRSWTLFLDRDGVLNKKRDNDYVKSLDELEILPQTDEAIAGLSNIFGRTVIVTNQQGIGKGLMTEAHLAEIHAHLARHIAQAGGKIDGFYHAPHLRHENSPLRKPHIGMALQAQKDFPEIDFKKSLMVGDSPSDMEFALKAGMVPVFVSDSPSEEFYTVPSLRYLQQVLGKILAG